MTTPSEGVRIMRDAILSLSLSEPFVHRLFDPFRVPPYFSLPADWAAAHSSSDDFVGGPVVGQVAVEM